MAKKFNDNEYQYDDEDSGEGTQTGTSGVEFHLDLLAGEPRDDLLSPEQLKGLLKLHNEKHYDLVKKQKIERKERNELKEGKRSVVSNAYSGKAGYGASSNFKSHPISQKAYFSGIDKKVTGLTTENIAETNEDKKNELQERLELRNRLQYQNAPKFNPTPRPT